MGPDFWLAIAQNARASFLEVVARGDDVIDLVADVMDAAGGVLVEKALDRGAFAKRIQKFDFGVRQFDKDHGHAVIGFVLRFADLGPEGIAVLVGGGCEVGNSDGDVVEAADHGGPPFPVCRFMRRGRASRKRPDVTVR